MIAALALAGAVLAAPGPTPEQVEIERVTREVCKRARTGTLIIKRECLIFVRSYLIEQVAAGRPEAIVAILDGDTGEAQALLARAREISR